jgi:hypothetical protein
MTPHDWITLAGLIIGSGGLWRALARVERFLERVSSIERAVADLATSHRAMVKQQAKLVDRVNDHEAQIRRW